MDSKNDIYKRKKNELKEEMDNYKVILKHNESGNTNPPESLEPGEMAINDTAGAEKIYFMNSDGEMVGVAKTEIYLLKDYDGNEYFDNISDLYDLIRRKNKSAKRFWKSGLKDLETLDLDTNFLYNQEEVGKKTVLAKIGESEYISIVSNMPLYTSIIDPHRPEWQPPKKEDSTVIVKKPLPLYPHIGAIYYFPDNIMKINLGMRHAGEIVRIYFEEHTWSDYLSSNDIKILGSPYFPDRIRRIHCTLLSQGRICEIEFDEDEQGAILAIKLPVIYDRFIKITGDIFNFNYEHYYFGSDNIEPLHYGAVSMKTRSPFIVIDNNKLVSTKPVIVCRHISDFTIDRSNNGGITEITDFLSVLKLKKYRVKIRTKTLRNPLGYFDKTKPGYEKNSQKRLIRAQIENGKLVIFSFSPDPIRYLRIIVQNSQTKISAGITFSSVTFENTYDWGMGHGVSSSVFYSIYDYASLVGESLSKLLNEVRYTENYGTEKWWVGTNVKRGGRKAKITRNWYWLPTNPRITEGGVSMYKTFINGTGYIKNTGNNYKIRVYGVHRNCVSNSYIEIYIKRKNLA